MRTRWTVMLVATCFAASFGVASTQALTITPGNNPLSSEQDLLVDSGNQGLTLQGSTSDTGTAFLLTGHELMTQTTSGQARVEAVDGSFTFLEIMAASGSSFQDIVLDPMLSGTGQLSGTLTITAFLERGGSVVSAPFALGQGSNYVTIAAGPGEALVGVALAHTGGNELDTVRHIRVGGLIDGSVAPVTSQVPAPSVLTLLGTSVLGVAGFTSWRRLRR